MDLCTEKLIANRIYNFDNKQSISKFNLLFILKTLWICLSKSWLIHSCQTLADSHHIQHCKTNWNNINQWGKRYKIWFIPRSTRDFWCLCNFSSLFLLFFPALFLSVIWIQAFGDAFLTPKKKEEKWRDKNKNKTWCFALFLFCPASWKGLSSQPMWCQMTTYVFFFCAWDVYSTVKRSLAFSFISHFCVVFFILSNFLFVFITI